MEPFNTVVLHLHDSNGHLVRDVQHALTMYMPSDTPDDDFVWVCPHCGTSDLPRKVHDVTSTPEILLVQLCRWAAAHADGAILDAVPVNEDVMFQGARYTLRSSILHQGMTPKDGHYITCARHDTSGGTWWYYNDTVRRLATSSERDSTNLNKSYILFNEKVHAA